MHRWAQREPERSRSPKSAGAGFASPVLEAQKLLTADVGRRREKLGIRGACPCPVIPPLGMRDATQVFRSGRMAFLGD